MSGQAERLSSAGIAPGSNRPGLQWWVWRLRARGATRLGTGGLIAAAFLLAGVLLCVALGMRLVASDRVQAAAGVESAASALPGGARPSTAPAAMQAPKQLTEAPDLLRQRWTQWPLESSHTRDLDRLVVVAQSHGVVFESGRVRRLAQADEPWVQIEMELRLNQPWSQVRAFLGGALNRMPHLALQSVRLARDDAAAARVEAQLVFRWVYRVPVAGGRP